MSAMVLETTTETPPAPRRHLLCVVCYRRWCGLTPRRRAGIGARLSWSTTRRTHRPCRGVAMAGASKYTRFADYLEDLDDVATELEIALQESAEDPTALPRHAEVRSNADSKRLAEAALPSRSQCSPIPRTKSARTAG